MLPRLNWLTELFGAIALKTTFDSLSYDLSIDCLPKLVELLELLFLLYVFSFIGNLSKLKRSNSIILSSYVTTCSSRLLNDLSLTPRSWVVSYIITSSSMSYSSIASAWSVIPDCVSRPKSRSYDTVTVTYVSYYVVSKYSVSSSVITESFLKASGKGKSRLF